ncbi:hypothetical protein [uncultured Maribacter sp.]|mgnify:CR=1 FL=1|uniref:hypothetical protein n=1 Tax=uncultured Maribacter sp. TaxID=431308 RepID=UPI0030EF0320|tara:strand:+ start:61342 stop:61695 length:354 start_codon:yes stop_codon:yes gene_type:complete
MKKLTFLGGVFVYFFLSINTTIAQDAEIINAKINKRTLLTQFESGYVLSVSERIALKQSRIAFQFRTREILDSLDISDKKRKRLIKELKRNPFSNRIQEVIANETKSEDSLKELTPN